MEGLADHPWNHSQPRTDRYRPKREVETLSQEEIEEQGQKAVKELWSGDHFQFASPKIAML